MAPTSPPTTPSTEPAWRDEADAIPMLDRRQVPARTEPDGDHPLGGPLVLVHGFTQTSACWGPIDVELAADRDLVLVDAPGHGGSTDVALDLADGGRAIAAAGGQGTYIGYSMGARFCLHAALDMPEQVERLVLVSATAGIEDTTDRAARRQDDETMADRVTEIGVAAFLDEWLALPLFAGLSADRQHRQARLANTAEGLASSLRMAGTGTQAPLWNRLPDLEVPVLVVAGAADTRFTALAERLAEGIGANAELRIVAGAGHTVHLEQPERFLAVLADWLARTAP